MINKINNTNTSFRASVPNLSRGTKFLDKFLKSQENLSYTRFIQGTLTNWMPKAILSRSFVDFSEFTFLEFIESGIFYFAAPFFGEHLFRHGAFKAVQPKNLKTPIIKNLTKSLNEIKNSNLEKGLKSRLTNTKAGVLLACVTVPAMEYALGFAKNLFTLKVFKISNFNNVANLDKKRNENLEQKNRVEKHSKEVLLKAGIVSVAGILSGLALARFGHKFKTTSKLAEILLEPGEYISKGLHKLGINSQKTDNFLKDYLKLDFVENNGKLSLSKGQLAATCITGLFGYSSAAKDRGKLDFLEVWTRVPLVVLYTIFGSALLDGQFKKYLAKKGKFPELIKQGENGIINAVPTRKELPKIAEKLSALNKTPYEAELGKLIKQKSVITGVPYLFSLIAMGFILSGVSRIWTQYRYNHQQKQAKESDTVSFGQNPIPYNSTAFKDFENFRKTKTC